MLLSVLLPRAAEALCGVFRNRKSSSLNRR
jgi:hypothetical protein